jgi:enoyl-CoA hydratase/carnithine racemase
MRTSIRVDVSDHVLTITIDRPEAMNALDPPAHIELSAIFDSFAGDPQLWIAIITGSGDRAFSAGNDLKYLAQTPPDQRIPFPKTGLAGITARFDLNKPIIAAVNGVAMGGGFEIALACDLIIAADTAIFALPEPMVGVAATEGGVHRLSRMIPLKQAMGMLLTGQRVTAAQGAAMGFVKPDGRGAEMGRRDHKGFAPGGSRHQRNGPLRPGVRDGAKGHVRHLSGARAPLHKPGLYRRAEGLCGKAAARLGGRLTLSPPTSRPIGPILSL